MENILISIDESTKSTGYAVFKNKELIDYGVIQENSKNTLERINKIITKLENLVEQYQPQNIVAEDIMITMSAPTAKALMGLQLLIELLAFKLNINCTTYRTTKWRKILGLSNSPKLKREDKKQETIDFINNKYQLNENIDDICDAIAIGTAYILEKGE